VGVYEIRDYRGCPKRARPERLEAPLLPARGFFLMSWVVTAATKRREMCADADTAKLLTMDEARRVASNIAKLPMLLLRG
jgi:hypothetical protein